MSTEAMYIDGEWVYTPDVIGSYDPSTGAVWTEIAAGDASQAAPADAPHLTRLVDFLRPETTAWWQYTLNTLSNTVPCAVPWSCREGFLDEWDPDLFDWDGECE